jgi:hypothetical protein
MLLLKGHSVTGKHANSPKRVFFRGGKRVWLEEGQRCVTTVAIQTTMTKGDESETDYEEGRGKKNSQTCSRGHGGEHEASQFLQSQRIHEEQSCSPKKVPMQREDRRLVGDWLELV